MNDQEGKAGNCIRINITLNPDVAEKSKAVAKDLGQSLSGLISLYLKQAIKEHSRREVLSVLKTSKPEGVESFETRLSDLELRLCKLELGIVQ